MRHRIWRYAVFRQDGQGVGLVSGRGLCSLGSGADVKPLLLPGEEEEGLVFVDGRAYRKSILLIAGFLLAAFKGIIGLEEFVVIVIVGRAVQRIGSRLMETLAVPPELRPISVVPEVVKKKLWMASMGMTTAAMPLTPL